MNEKIASFGKHRSLIGIITEPDIKNSKNLPAVILLNSGIIHRVGPGRLYVKLARELAKSGFTVLRFDFSSIGDSQVCDEDISFENRTVNEIREAMDYLYTESQTEQFVLMGICSGAEISYKTICSDSRVIGAIPINARTLLDISDTKLKSAVKNRSEASYMLKSSITNPKSWLKLLKGKADYKKILRVMKYQTRKLFPTSKELSPDAKKVKSDIQSILDRHAHLLLVYSEKDQGLDYIKESMGDEINRFTDNPNFKLKVVNSDHTFTLIDNQHQLIKLIANWLNSSFR